VFGFSFGELVMLVIVAIVVIGPKDLPKVLRQMGRWAGKLRRMASDMRAQSGIDDVLRSEGLTQDIAEIRKLARGELDMVARSARLDDVVSTGAPRLRAEAEPVAVEREREQPVVGPDSYGALPDTAIVYAETLPVSPLAKDPLYSTGSEVNE
jgi:sec-independent protein translocase protein TatB